MGRHRPRPGQIGAGHVLHDLMSRASPTAQVAAWTPGAERWIQVHPPLWSTVAIVAVSPLLSNVYLHVCPQGKRGDVEGRFVIRAVPVMEVGPLGSPCRRGAQTAVMSCRSKAGVGSDYGKGPLTAGQVCDEKTNVVETLLTHRKTMTTSQPGSVHISGRASRHWAWCSQRTACVSLWRCSVLRWRELVVGAGTEEENLCLDTVGWIRSGVGGPVGREREDLGRQKPSGAEYREAQGRTGSY